MKNELQQRAKIIEEILNLKVQLGEIQEDEKNIESVNLYHLYTESLEVLQSIKMEYILELLG